ncbi:unnamed protein product [Staurois parvus]|uniref:Uncharacterized protein n=1 Tax=Staurois parvus TaxID=386267 RepID=A0ABN9HHV1_9NEOB|nr:unnamed protein product [Staurois parvus]
MEGIGTPESHDWEGIGTPESHYVEGAILCNIMYLKRVSIKKIK